MKDKDGRLMPSELSSALKGDKDALSAWNRMTRSHQRDYTRWVSDTVEETTRLERAELALEMLKNWREEKGYSKKIE